MTGLISVERCDCFVPGPWDMGLIKLLSEKIVLTEGINSFALFVAWLGKIIAV
jgi:hypothetical protein